MVWYRCTRKGCQKRMKQHVAATFVSHRGEDGSEHIMRREEPRVES